MLSYIFKCFYYNSSFNTDSKYGTFEEFLNISIPLMIRGQYEYSLGVTYISTGIRMNFTTPFSMDVAFAVGQEFRVGGANYLGLRLGYNLNVLHPYEGYDLFQDDLTVAITYRYAFNSKW